MDQNSLESCGYCKYCLRLRTLRILGREPNYPIECAYRHILTSYLNPDFIREHSERSIPQSMSSSPAESCRTNCRWVTMSGSSDQYDPAHYDDIWGTGGSCNKLSYVPKKRIIFSKRKSVK